VKQVLCSGKSEFQEVDLIDTCTFGKVRTTFFVVPEARKTCTC
jgi:hypothetical protein